MNNNIKNHPIILKLISLALFSIPLFYYMYLVYIRIILERAPRNITIIESNIKLMLIIFIILCFAIRIYVLLRKLDLISQEPSKKPYIIRFRRWLAILNYHIHGLKTNFLHVLSYLKYYNPFALWLIQTAYKTVESRKFTFLLLMVEVGIKMLLIVVFTLEVFYFKQINYFYKLLGLLLIVLIKDIFIEMMNLFRYDNMTRLLNLLDSKPIEGTEYHEFCFSNEYFIPDFLSDIDDLIENHLCPLFDYPYTLQHFETIRKKYKVYLILLLVNLTYFFTWLYILFVGLAII